MVRGNWQKRVEAADARRKENRHRKQASCHKRHYKQWVQDLQDLLDRNCDRLQQKSSLWKLQIWTDTLAIAADDDQQFDHVDEGNDDFVGDADARKKRSKSLGNLDEDKGRKAKGRGRSNSTIEPPYSTGKKKVHPRSKEALEESTMTDDAVPQLCLCRSFFFTGTCDQLASRGSGRKSGGCRYVHFSNSTTATTTRDLTLCHVLSNSKLQRNNAVAELKRAEQAEMKAAVAESSGSASDRVGAMEMVFYLEAVLDANKSGNSENRDTRFSEQISDLLSSKQLYLASVVYIALDEVLVFDRFRDGLLYPTDREFLVAVLGENAGGSRRDVDGSREDAAVTALLSIPGTVLEHILAFLPDRAVAALSRVCTAWHYEIGRNSPSLWKHMLNRRDWPLPIGHGSLDLHAYRDQFLQHYAVVRDMTAIQNGLDAILDPRKTAVLEEVAYQDFSTRKHAPSYPNCCVGLQEWSPNRLLVAYNHDCSLRLFETHGEKVCRELICQRVDPYRNTKKRHCRIVSMGLDEQCVASLCHVTGNPGLDAEAFVLVVITRDDFLLGESSGAADMASGCAEDVSNLKVIDVGEAVLNYLLSSDDGDHRLLQLIDFLSEGGDVGDVEVLASQALASCGYGRFMVEVSISIPTEDDDGRMILHLIDRKLVLFSSTIGAIVWLGESCPQSHELRPRRVDMTLAYLRRPLIEGGSRAACFFAVGSATSPAIMVGEIEPSGEVQSAHLLESSLMVRNEILEAGLEVLDIGYRPILVTPTHVVVADVLVRRVEGVFQMRKTVVSFYSRYPSSSDEPTYSTVTVPGNLEVLRMACIRGHHVVLVCRQFSSPPQSMPPPTAENEHDGAVDAIAEAWFDGAAVEEAAHDPPVDDSNNDEEENIENGVRANSTSAVKITAVILHVPSRREIGRLDLLHDGGQEPGGFLPHLVVDGNETIGLGLTWEGIVMTGGDVRMMLILDDEQRAAKKKQKKRMPAKKKDGFARGKSMHRNRPI